MVLIQSLFCYVINSSDMVVTSIHLIPWIYTVAGADRNSVPFPKVN